MIIVEKSVSYFYLLPTDYPTYMADHVRLLLAGLNNLETEVQRARALLDQAAESSAVGLLLKQVEALGKEVESHVMRRLPADGSQRAVQRLREDQQKLTRHQLLRYQSQDRYSV